MENILESKPTIEIFLLNTDRKIAKAKIINVTDFEIEFAIVNRIEDMKMGDSIQCKFHHQNKNVRFNAKVKDDKSFFLLGELIFDDEKNYLRVDDDIKINYKKIQISEIDSYMNKVYSSNDENITELSAILDRSDNNYKIMQYLISRIDELSERISDLTDIIQNNGKNAFEEMFVNISASGMKIKKQEKVKIGDILFLEIKLDINLRYHIINIIGEVIKVEENHFIIEYRMISGRAKEYIIRYSLQKEREKIRLHKGGE